MVRNRYDDTITSYARDGWSSDEAAKCKTGAVKAVFQATQLEVSCAVQIGWGHRERPTPMELPGLKP